MPELPEVEIVCRNLNSILKKDIKLVEVKLWRKDIRFPIPEKSLKKICKSTGSKIVQISRRAKFIQIEFANDLIISHLGMTGNWSVYRGDLKKYLNKKHDHLALGFESNLWLIYNDPRRFGFLDVVSKSKLEKYFSNYGVEPLSMNETDIEKLFSVAKQSKSPVKSFIMNQKNIVGVGNIYACEALFLAGLNPFKSTNKVKKDSFFTLISQIKKNLSEAILKGGSSIKNYRNVNEESGGFQKSHLVYNKENQLCSKCKTKLIQRKVLAGRSTFFCSACQT